MLHVRSECSCCISMLLVPAAWSCSLSLLYEQTAWTNCMDIQTWTWKMPRMGAKIWTWHRDEHGHGHRQRHSVGTWTIEFHVSSYNIVIMILHVIRNFRVIVILKKILDPLVLALRVPYRTIGVEPWAETLWIWSAKFENWWIFPIFWRIFSYSQTHRARSCKPYRT